jgi:hypothetical protein
MAERQAAQQQFNAGPFSREEFDAIKKKARSS